MNDFLQRARSFEQKIDLNPNKVKQVQNWLDNRQLSPEQTPITPCTQEGFSTPKGSINFDLLPDAESSAFTKENSISSLSPSSRHLVTSTPNVNQFNNRLRSKRKGRPENSRQRIRIVQPKDFGLTQWNPDESDITTHLDVVSQCVAEARLIGATESNLIRLLMRTMPESYKFLSEFIDSSKQTTYEHFSAEIARILSKRAPVKMATFLTATRKTGEHLLQFFFRITNLYKSSNGLTDNNWRKDPSHAVAVLAKIFESLDENSKTELTRRLEPHIEKGNITIEKIKRHLVEVSKLGSINQNLTTEKQSITTLEGKRA